MSHVIFTSSKCQTGRERERERDAIQIDKHRLFLMMQQSMSAFYLKLIAFDIFIFCFRSFRSSIFLRTQKQLLIHFRCTQQKKIIHRTANAVSHYIIHIIEMLHTMIKHPNWLSIRIKLWLN